MEVLDASSASLYDGYAHAYALSTQCTAMLGGGPASVSSNSADSKVMEAGLGRFVSTPSVARDMLQIMEKAGEEKLKYWGFSYGTYLGATFAAMFPDKVGRLVNDGILCKLLVITALTFLGNVDAIEFSFGNGTHFVMDTDKVMESFYHFCHLAGPTDCAFYSETPELIEARLNNLLQRLKTNPVIVPAPNSSGKRPQIVKYSSARRMIASALYRPLLLFPTLAVALSELELGDGRQFIDLSGQGSGDPFLCESDPGPSPELPEVEGSGDASNAVLCSDGGIMTATAQEFGEYVDMLTDISKSAGPTMSEMRLACVGYTVEAKWRFSGILSIPLIPREITHIIRTFPREYELPDSLHCQHSRQRHAPS
jgi:hypothetical protein